MATVVYEIIPHDGGWAYRVGGTYSETFPVREAAVTAAHAAASRQRRPGDDASIRFEDAQGRWKTEQASGSDRPETRAGD